MNSGFNEGLLTLIISEAVREETRAQVARNLRLEQYVKTEITPRTLATTLSAVIGKINLVSLDPVAETYIVEHYQPFIDYSVSKVLTGLRTVDQAWTTRAMIKTPLRQGSCRL